MKDSIIEFLIKEADSFKQWVEIKETAAWLAIVFYITIIGFCLYFFHIQYHKKNIKKLELIVAIIVIFPVSYAFLTFIFTQYASIHAYHAHNEAIKKCIQEASKNDDFYLDINDFLNKIDEEYINIQNYRYHKFDFTINQFLNRHPIKIMLRLPAMTFGDVRNRLFNHFAQEAAIYWLLLISTFIFIAKLVFLINSNNSINSTKQVLLINSFHNSMYWKKRRIYKINKVRNS